MWSRSVKLEASQGKHWWDRRRQCLDALGPFDDFHFEAATLASVGALLGFEETVSAGVFASMHRHGVLAGLLFASADEPATILLAKAGDAFAEFARSEGCELEEPWAIVDMRATLAESLAAQTLSLELAGIATARSNEALFAFVPNWRVWEGSGMMEAAQEAA